MLSMEVETAPAAQEAAPGCHDNKLLVWQTELHSTCVEGMPLTQQSACRCTPLVWDDDHLGYQEWSRGMGTRLAPLGTFSSLLFQPF